MYRINSVWYDILKYPLLQYIPLKKEVIFNKDTYLFTSNLHIKAFYQPENLERLLNILNTSREYVNVINWKQELPMVSMNLFAQDLKYRGIKVTALASEEPGYFELFTVNRTYFYRNQFYLSVYDMQGKKLKTPTEIFYVD